MSPQIILLIVVLVILIFAALFYIGGTRDNLRLSRLFYEGKCTPTKKLGRLWIDEKNKMWSAPSAGRLYSYREIIGCDIVVDGISLGDKRRTYKTEPSGAEAAASAGKTFERIVVVVMVGNNAADTVNIPIGNGAARINSQEFDKYMRLAEDTCKELDDMKNENKDVQR